MSHVAKTPSESKMIVLTVASSGVVLFSPVRSQGQYTTINTNRAIPTVTQHPDALPAIFLGVAHTLFMRPLTESSQQERSTSALSR